MTDPFVDRSGEHLYRVVLRDATFRLVDLTGAVLRDVSLKGAEIDGEIDGLVINGVEVAPLVEAELIRREPARAKRRSSDPAELREVWESVQQLWAQTYDRAAKLPAGSVDVSVAGEWTFTQTLRHLVFATDVWLGAIDRNPQPHPWGLPFTDITDFADPADLGVDVDAAPSYAEVLELRTDRVARVRDVLATVTPQRMAEEVAAPVWDEGRPVSVARCLWVIINEEFEHRRFAERDLAAIEADR